MKNIHEDKQQAFDLMSDDSVTSLVDCLLARIALCRNLEAKGAINELQSYIWNEPKILKDFLTALYGSGFNHTVRKQKEDKGGRIDRILDGLTPDEVLSKTIQVANQLY